MSGQNAGAPIIIKRKKVAAGDGHHGGAWKVAYADFVTAMMAFFLLMWLLNATTETQRKGIADYFTPTIPLSTVSGGGDGAFGGDSVFSEGALAQNGTGASSLATTESRQARGETGLRSESDSDEGLMRLEDALLGRSEDMVLEEETFEHLKTRVTEEGLVIEIFETHDGPLFDPSNDFTPLFLELMALIAEVSTLVDNQIAIEGHVPASPIIVAEDQSWALSAQRAQSVRMLLGELGVEDARIRRIVGHADREPSVADNRMSIRNSRIDVIFLR